jgi:hypothetical protein
VVVEDVSLSWTPLRHKLDWDRLVVKVCTYIHTSRT